MSLNFKYSTAARDEEAQLRGPSSPQPPDVQTIQSQNYLKLGVPRKRALRGSLLLGLALLPFFFGAAGVFL